MAKEIVPRMGSKNIRKTTKTQDKNRKRAHSILRGLDVKLLKILDQRVEQTIRYDRILNDPAERVKFTPQELRLMAETRMTNLDVQKLHQDVQDRVGTPKRNALEELMSDPSRTPITLVQGVTWISSEGAQGALVVGAVGGGGARSSD